MQRYLLRACQASNKPTLFALWKYDWDMTTGTEHSNRARLYSGSIPVCSEAWFLMASQESIKLNRNRYMSVNRKSIDKTFSKGYIFLLQFVLVLYLTTWKQKPLDEHLYCSKFPRTIDLSVSWPEHCPSTVALNLKTPRTNSSNISITNHVFLSFRVPPWALNNSICTPPK